MTAGEGGAAATCGCPGHFCSLLASSAEIISPGGAHHGDSQAQEGVLQARTLVLHRYAETEMRGIVPEESAVTFKNRHKELSSLLKVQAGQLHARAPEDTATQQRDTRQVTANKEAKTLHARTAPASHG